MIGAGAARPAPARLLEFRAAIQELARGHDSDPHRRGGAGDEGLALPVGRAAGDVDAAPKILSRRNAEARRGRERTKVKEAWRKEGYPAQLAK